MIGLFCYPDPYHDTDPECPRVCGPGSESGSVTLDLFVPGCPWALTSLTIWWGICLPGAVCTILGPPAPALVSATLPFGIVAILKSYT